MKPGMIKVCILYPGGDGKTFDMDYYTSKHIPMVAGLLGDAVKGATVEQGLSGSMPGTPAPYAATGNLYFDSIDSFLGAFGPHAQTIMGDIPNYTNAEPVVLISKVIM